MKNFTTPSVSSKATITNIGATFFKQIRLMGLFMFASLFANAQSNHTVAFTGALADFTVTTERFAAAANNTTYAITFDATYMYFGAFRTTGTFGDGDNFSIFLDADPRNTPASGNGTTAGKVYNGVTPVLPFNADYCIRMEGTIKDNLFLYNGGWTTTLVDGSTFIPNTASGTDYFQSTTCREMRIPLQKLGNPASVYVSVFMGYAGGIFSSAPAADVAASATPTLTGYFGSFPVYKSGISPMTFRTQTTAAGTGGGTPISNLSFTTATHTGDYGDITFVSGATATVSTSGLSFTGTMSWNTGSTGTNLLVPTSATLFVGGRGVGGTAGQMTVTTSSTTANSFSASSAGTISFLGNGIINGTNTLKTLQGTIKVTTGGALDFNTATSINTGSSLQINTGGSVVGAPTYNAASTLIYNTGTSYTANNEWAPNITTGAGYPGKVTVQGNTSLNFGAASTFRQAAGLITVASGSSLTLSSASGGDLNLAAGGFTNNNTGTGVGLNTNGRAVQMQASCTWTKAGTENVDFLIFPTNAILSLASGTNLNLTNTNVSGCLQFNTTNNAITMLGTNTVNIAAGCSITGSKTSAINGSTPSTSLLVFAGTATHSNSGVTTVGTGVGVIINGGLSLTTVNKLVATTVQINEGGFVSTNPIVYAGTSTLTYNHTAVTGTYGVGANEWPAASGPTNVTVNANGGTGISFGNNNITARTLTGTLTVAAGQNVSLTGTGTPNVTVFNTTAGAGSTISGTGTYTHSASGTFTTANTGGINGTLTTSGTKTLPTSTNFVFNNATASQVTGTLLPATIATLTINNPTAATGTTISNNTLVISGTTTLTAGALVLPTGVSNLVTMTGALSAVTGTITGSSTSNLINTGGASTSVGFTTGAASLFNWSVPNSDFGSSATVGLSSVVTINGTFSLASVGVPDIYITSTGGLNIANGGFYTDNTTSGNRVLGAGSFTLQSGSTFTTGHTSGLFATAATGPVQVTGTRTFSGGANYVFNYTGTQGVGDALDGTPGTGKTGPITGSVTNANTNAASGLTLNAGTTITINTPGTFNVGINASTSSILTAPATSVVNGTGNVNMFGNGATSGSTLITAHVNGVNGTFPGTGTFSLTNGANNNTNFTFNGAAAQVTGTLLPATIGALAISNILGASSPTADVTLTSSVIVNGAFTNTGRLGVGANTLTLNGAATFSTNKLAVSSSSNISIGGSGTISGASPFTTGGVTLTNFTMNRSAQTFTVNSALTVTGTFSLSNGIVSLSGAGLTLSGAITFGSGTLTGGSALVINGSGAITGNLTGTASPLALTGLTMNRTGATVTLGSNLTVSNTTGLTLTAGNIALGTFNLTSTGANGLGTGSTGSMVVATGSGQAFNTVPTSSFVAQTWPIGDGTNYTPVILTFSANTVGGTVGVKTVASTHPNINTGNTASVSIARYWTFTNTSLTNYTYSGTFRYISPGDVAGTEANLKLSRYNGAAWTEFAGSSVASPVLSSGSLTQATGPLTLDYTGRTGPAPVSYTWVGFTDGVWGTAANWSPSGVPSSIDNVTLANGSTGAAANLNLTTAVTVTNITFNGTGSFFTVGSAGAITASGTVVYTAGTGSWDPASTFTISSVSSQPIPPFNYGNLTTSNGNRVWTAGTTGIAGTFTPGAGTYAATSGSTVDYNGAAGQNIQSVNYFNLTNSNNTTRTTLTGTIDIAGAYTPTTAAVTNSSSNFVNFSSAGAQTIPATSYNNVTNTGNGPRTLASSGTIAVAGPTFTPGSGAYTVTGSTVDFSNATGFTIPVLTPAATNNYNNLTISGAGAYPQGASLTIGGNFTQSAGVYNVTSSASVYNLTVAGGFTLSGAALFNVTNTSASTTATAVTVTGNTTTSGTSEITLEATANANAGGTATFTTTDFSTTSTATTGIVDFGAGSNLNGNQFIINGNVSKSGTGVFYTTGSPTAPTSFGFVFNKTGTQTFNYAGTASSYASYTVASTSTLQLTADFAFGTGTSNPPQTFTVNGIFDMQAFKMTGMGAQATQGFTLAAGATLKTANTLGVNDGTANSSLGGLNATATKTYTAGAKYEFNAGAAQSTGFSTIGAGLGNPNSITASGAGTVLTPDVNITFGNTATLNVGTGATLVAAAARTFTFGTGGVVNVTGTLRTANVTATDALSGSATSTIVNTNTPTINLNSGSVVEFNGAAAQFAAARTFAGLTVNNSTGVSMLGSITTTTLGLTSGNLTIGTNTLTVNGAVSRTSGNLAGSNTSNLTIGGTAGSLFFDGTGTNNYLKNFTINTGATATLGNALNITGGASANNEGTLEVAGTGVLTTGGFLAIKSNSFGTARIAANTSGGTYISGTVSVERFIRQNGNKAWRLLASNTSGQSINAAWQEGAAPLANPNPGFGTMITAGNAITTNLTTAQTAGFDALSLGVSLFKYNPATDVLDVVPFTNSTNDIGAEPGYFVFIRGDRSALFAGTGAPTTSTVLRSKGSLFLGTKTTTTGAKDYALARNPYASRIDLRDITFEANVTPAVQVWDPAIGSGYGVGGYVTLNRSGGPGTDFYVVNASPSYGAAFTVQNYVESGAAFFIQSGIGAVINKSIIIPEGAKEIGSSNPSFRPSTPLAGEGRLSFNLYANNAGTFDVVDGGLALFNDNFNNAVDVNDVRKNFNFNENFGIKRDNIDLVVEKRQQANVNDTIFFNMSQLRQISYKLDIEASNIDPLITTAILEDKYTNTSTAIDLSTINSYSFTVDATAASRAADRFRIVFRQTVVVPVSFVSVRAAQAGNNIAVEWKVANELNTKHYEIEKSTDGRSFAVKGTIVASGISTYNWLDENIATGYNYYRIKSVDNNGQVKYTAVVKVQVGGKAGISVVNPVRGNAVNLQFANQPAGKYGIRITNIAGQVVYNREVTHNGGSASQSFVLSSPAVTGVYQLEVVRPDNTRTVERLIINQGN